MNANISLYGRNNASFPEPARLLPTREGPFLVSPRYRVSKRACWAWILACAALLAIAPASADNPCPNPADPTDQGAENAGSNNSTCDPTANAFGQINDAKALQSNAFGYSNTASGLYSSAFGRSNSASGNDSNAFGDGNFAFGQSSSAFGRMNSAFGEHAVAVGESNDADGASSNAVGNSNIAGGTNSSALGSFNTATGEASSAVGYNNHASAQSAVAMGRTNTASGQFSAALGIFNTASGVRSSAFGYNSQAIADDSIAIGSSAIADRAGTLSVGAAGAERQIVNVASGTQAMDAVNLSQLHSTLATANAYTDTAVATGGTATNAYTDNRETAIRGDMTAGDAATLSNANAYTESRIAAIDLNLSRIDDRFARQDKRISRIGAMGTAMAQMTASAAGIRQQNRLAVGTGVQAGHAALAVGYQRAVSDSATFTLGGAFSGNGEDTVGMGLGIGW